MSEQVNESISALMDDEANELDLRRVLKSADDSEETQQQMRRFQLARSAMQDSGSAMLDIDLSASISAAIEAEPGAGKLRPAWMKQLGGFAVAASVAAIVVVGSQSFQLGQSDSAAPQFAQQAPSISQPAIQTRRQEAQTVTLGASVPVNTREQQLLLAQQQRRVNAYMQIHARHASMNGNLGAVPLARSADYRVR